MAQRRNSAQPAEDIGSEKIETAETAVAVPAAPAQVPAIAWPVDDDSSLAELLAEHGFAGKLTARLIELASAPTHAKRPVDRLAIALGAQFNFFALDEAWKQPILLCGLPGAGVSTLAAKLAARFDDSEVRVIAAGAHDEAKTALLAENLDALYLPLTRAADAAALRRAVGEAGGRKVIIDVAARSPFDAAQVKEFIAASGAAGMLVISAEVGHRGHACPRQSRERHRRRTHDHDRSRRWALSRRGAERGGCDETGAGQRQRHAAFRFWAARHHPRKPRTPADVRRTPGALAGRADLNVDA